jgi:hypothetical protein
MKILTISNFSKSKLHHRRDHEGSEGVQSYSWTLSLTSALDGGGGERQASAALHPAKRSFGQGAGKGPGPDWKGARKISPPPGLDHRNVQPIKPAICIAGVLS